MVMGLVGRKVGMTRIVADDGRVLPVTVIHVAPNLITQVKDVDNDGYKAVQVTTGERRPQRVSNALTGHYRKSGVAAGRLLREFRVEDTAGYAMGGEIGLDVFAVGQRVDVSGISKGKGFAGAIKRHNFRSNRASHGNSLSHRAPAPSAAVRPRVGCSRASVWPGIWGPNGSPRKSRNWYGLTRIDGCS